MYAWIAGVMLASGVVGGIVNYFLLDKSTDSQMPWWQCVVLGVAAAFIVPLFLNMISSGLVSDILGVPGQAGDASKLLVLAGFCLVAAISSRAFIDTVSKQVLQDAREAKVDAARAQEDAAEARATLESVVEPDDAGEESESETEQEVPTGARTEIELSGDERAVIDVMANSSFAMRSLSGLSKQSGLDQGRVRIALASLVDRALVARGKSRSGYPRWYLTTDGRIAVARI